MHGMSKTAIDTRASDEANKVGEKSDKMTTVNVPWREK